MNKRWGLSILLVSNFLVADGFDNQTEQHGQDKVAMIKGYAQLATSILHKGYAFFTKEIEQLDLQKDVLDIPYKNMLYTTTQEIEDLFNDANKHDDPHAQIKALILLCRMPVPEWYFKSFHKGMDAVFESCFDEQGNFNSAASIVDIRFMFKEYCKKTPSNWQQIARISPWWCRNKKPYPVYTKYYAMTCTDFNEDLLRMIELDPVQDLGYLSYFVAKHDSAPVLKIYHAHVTDTFKHNFATILPENDHDL